MPSRAGIPMWVVKPRNLSFFRIGAARCILHSCAALLACAYLITVPTRPVPVVVIVMYASL